MSLITKPEEVGDAYFKLAERLSYAYGQIALITELKRALNFAIENLDDFQKRCDEQEKLIAAKNPLELGVEQAFSEYLAGAESTKDVFQKMHQRKAKKAGEATILATEFYITDQKLLDIYLAISSGVVNFSYQEKDEMFWNKAMLATDRKPYQERRRCVTLVKLIGENSNN